MSRRIQGFVAIGVLVLACCGGSLPHPPWSPQATSALTPVPSPPPPGRVEAIPPKPSGADAWVDGEWVLRHGRWYWLLGRWVKAPPSATYAPWVVVHGLDGTTYYAPSVWQDASGHAISPPPALAFAVASGEGIVGPSGDAEDLGRNIQVAPSARAKSEQDEEEAPDAGGDAN